MLPDEGFVYLADRPHRRLLLLPVRFEGTERVDMRQHLVRKQGQTRERMPKPLEVGIVAMVQNASHLQSGLDSTRQVSARLPGSRMQDSLINCSLLVGSAGLRGTNGGV